MLLVNQRNQSVTNLKLQGIKRQKGLHILRGIGSARSLGRALARLTPCLTILGVFPFLFIRRKTAANINHGGEAEKGHCRQAGNQRKQHENTRHKLQSPAVERQLGHEFFAHLGFRRRSGNQKTCGGRDNDGRNGGHKTVTDGQQRIGRQSCFPFHTFLHHTNNDATNNVDHGDHHTGFDVTRDKFTGTVHGTVEIGLLTQSVPTRRSFFFINKTGVEISFNGHLLTGHGIKGKTGGNFSDTCSTGCDHNLIEGEHDHEDNGADHIATTDHKFTKRADNAACSINTHITVEQNKTRGSNVQGKTQQGCHQKQ